jgi:hypothetical protein
MKPHHLPQLLLQAQLGIGAEPTPDCGISRIHWNDLTIIKILWTSWKD